MKDGERWPPMVDSLTVAAGLEAALGAALGEELTSAPIPRRGAALARTAAVRPAPRRCRTAPTAAGRLGAGPVGARPCAVADRPGRNEDDRRRAAAVLLAPARSLVSRAGAQSGAGTAIPFAPAHRPQPRFGCSSATG